MQGDDNHWVALDVAADALQVSKPTAYRLAKQHRWRTATGKYPKQYLFADIARTHKERNTRK